MNDISLNDLSKFLPLNTFSLLSPKIHQKLNFIKNFAVASDGGLGILCADREGNYAGKKVVNEIFFRTESCR